MIEMNSVDCFLAMELVLQTEPWYECVEGTCLADLNERGWSIPRLMPSL
jgi:hypothetical protein